MDLERHRKCVLVIAKREIAQVGDRMDKIARLVAAVSAASLIAAAAPAAVLIQEQGLHIPAWADPNGWDAGILPGAPGLYRAPAAFRTPAAAAAVPGPSSPAVTEPMTWALTLAGLGTAGWALRRRRANARISFA